MPHVEGPVVGGGGRKPDRDRDPLCGVWLDDRFLIEERIATGGFGAVYRGRAKDGLPVALKVLHGWLTSDDRIVARFRREGATLTQLHDPHTVRTLAVGETGDGLLYIAMELLTGESLHDLLKRAGVLPWQAAVAIARAVCSALAEAHALGVVHRDLKPANIHMAGDVVKVIDFGIAKITRGSAVDDGRELTHAGHMVGTCDYMSPEQLTTNDCRAPSDIYALGLVLYEMLAGQRAFPQVTGPAAMLATLLTQTPAPPSIHAAIPPALDRVVMRCIERDVDARYASVGELIAALDAVVAARHTREEITVVTPAVAPATWIDSASPWPVEPDALASDRTIATAPLDLGIAEEAEGQANDQANDQAGANANANAKPGDTQPRPWDLFTTLPGIAVAPKRPPRRAGQLAAQPSLPPTIPPDNDGDAALPSASASASGRRRIADPDVSLAAPTAPIAFGGAAFGWQVSPEPDPDFAWIPPLPQADARLAPPIAPMARGSSSDLHAAATLERRRAWALAAWLAFLIVCTAAITCAVLLR